MRYRRYIWIKLREPASGWTEDFTQLKTNFFCHILPNEIDTRRKIYDNEMDQNVSFSLSRAELGGH